MNVPTMTIGETEQDNELMNLRKENEELKARNEELKARCADYDLQVERLTRQAEHNYMRGRIDGLEFSIRCNGVSGDEVKK